LSSYYQSQIDSNPKPLTLEHIASLKVGELAGLLAGAVCANPIETIPLLEGLNLAELNRPHVAAFLRACTRQYATLKNLSCEACSVTLTGIAFQQGCFIDLARWMSRVCIDDRQAVEIVRGVVIQLKELIVARRVLYNLQGYASELEP
jgi:hypothetical protein